MNLWLVGWTPNPSVWNSPQGNRRGSSNLMFRYQKWCCLYFTTLDLRCVVQKARIHEILGQGRSGLCILKELAKWRIICFKRDGALHGVEISRWQITPQRYCSMLPFVDFFSFSKAKVFASCSNQSSSEKKLRILLRAFGPISFPRERESHGAYVSARTLSVESFTVWLRRKIISQTSIYLTGFAFTSVDMSSGFSTRPPTLSQNIAVTESEALYCSLQGQNTPDTRKESHEQAPAS
jgi:hypothetical protein